MENNERTFWEQYKQKTLLEYVYIICLLVIIALTPSSFPNLGSKKTEKGVQIYIWDRLPTTLINVHIF